jgi:hypothetical protein
MSELLQREDLVKDRKLVRSLYDLNFRRTGIRSRDAGKLVDDFLTEYRGMHITRLTKEQKGFCLTTLSTLVIRLVH